MNRLKDFEQYWKFMETNRDCNFLLIPLIVSMARDSEQLWVDIDSKLSEMNEFAIKSIKLMEKSDCTSKILEMLEEVND